MFFYRIFLTSLSFLYLCSHIYGQNCQIFNYTTRNGLPQNNLSQLMFDKNDKLWIGTQGGLCVYDGKKIHQGHHPDLSPRIYYIHKDAYHEIFICDDHQNLYVTNKSNYNIQKINSGQETYYNWVFNAKDYEKNKTIDAKNHYRSFIINRLGYKNFKNFKKNGTTHFVTLDSKILELKSYFLLDSVIIGLTHQKKWIKYNNSLKQEPITTNMPYDFITKGFTFNTDEATYWLYNNTIYQLKLIQNQLKSIPILVNVPLDPITEQINCGQYNANTGNFYFGSAKNGLYVIKPSYFNVKKHRSYQSHPLLLEFGHAYYSQAQMDSSSIFVNNYLVIKDSTDILLNNVIYPNNRAANFIDNKGWLWYSDDQFIFINKNSQKNQISLVPLSYPILSLSQIASNRYLLLHPYYIIEADTSKELRRFALGTFQNSNYEYGQYLYYDKHKDLLYLLTNRKIYTVNLQTEQITPVPSLRESDFRIMTSIKDQIIFIGTYGQGYLLKIGDKYFEMPMDKNEYLKFAHAALIDNNDNVWISTNNGLFRTRLQDMIDYTQGKRQDVFYYYYDNSSGFLTNEFNGGCQSPAIKLKDGRFSFSSMDGLVQFDPYSIPTNFPTNKVQIIGLTLNGKIQDTLPLPLMINQDIKDIKLEVSTAYYGHPDNLVIQYRIPGYVDEWRDITDNRYIVLQNVRHGSFNIEIRKRHGFGNDDFDYIIYPVEVLPYFYQTWWFLSILFFLGLLLSYLFSRWYNRYIIRKNIALQALIDAQKADLVHSNNHLKEQIKQNDLFQSILVHDIKSPLRFIKSTTKLILGFWPKVTDDIKKENIANIYESASKIGSFVEETILWIQIRNGEHEPQLSNVNINDILKENVTLYQEDPKILSNDITVHIDCLDELYMTTDSSLISTIIRNLLSNSIKYSERGKIILYAYQEKNNVIYIGCKDEGKGLDQKTIDAILSDDYKGNTIRKDSFRLGYVIIKEILRLLNGKLHIRSTSHLGSDICMIFEQHYY